MTIIIGLYDNHYVLELFPFYLVPTETNHCFPWLAAEVKPFGPTPHTSSVDSDSLQAQARATQNAFPVICC